MIAKFDNQNNKGVGAIALTPLSILSLLSNLISEASS